MPKRKRYLDNGGKPDRKTVYKAKYTGKIYNTAREAAIDNTRYLREPINRFDAKSKEYPRYKELNIPFIEEKRRTLSNAGLATGAVISENLLDSIAKYANLEGLPLKTALGLVTKESTLGNPTDDKSVYKLLGEDKALFFKRGGGGQFINKGGQDVDARGLVNYYKDTWNPYEEAIKIAKIKATGSNGVFVKPVNWGNDDNPNYLEALDEYNKQKAIFDKTLIEGEKYADRQAEKKRGSIRGNVLQAAFRDYKNNPNGYNPGQRNYPQLVERRGNEVWTSPEIQNWYKNRTNKRNGGRISLRNGGRSSFVRNLETQPTILEQFAEYNKEPKIRKASKETVKQQRIREQKAANQRERNIAKQYLATGPNIGNLVKAAYHWYNSVPILGGQNESGLDLQTGEAPNPSVRTSATVANNSVSIADRVLEGYKGKPSDAIVTKYRELRDFLKSHEYRTRLAKYLRSVGREGDNKIEVTRQLNNIQAAKVAVVPKGYIVDSDGSLVKARGMYSTKEHLIQVEDVNLHSTTPKHEMIHARNRGKAYANNSRYKMRTLAEQKLNKELAEGNIMKNSPKADALEKDAKYYGDVVEQEPRVLNTLAHMKNEGYDINNLSDKDIAEYFDGPIDLYPRDTQSLYENYVWEDIPNALRNFKNIAIPIIATGVGYKVGRRYFDEQRPQQRSGGTIHIAPSKRGTFTAAATRHGMGVQEFANTVLRNKDRYSPNLVKKANFARNASKWNH